MGHPGSECTAVHMAAISSVVTQRWVELRDVTKTAREEDYAVI